MASVAAPASETTDASAHHRCDRPTKAVATAAATVATINETRYSTLGA